jgi:hypothetical protein
MTAMPRNPVPILLIAALAAGCATDRELTGAAAARSRGAGAPGPAAGEGGAAPLPAPSAPYDQFLDDARVLAKVNGKVITIAEVRHRIQDSYDRNLDQRDLLAVQVNKEVGNLVLQRLVIDEGTRVGIDVTDAEMEENEEWAKKAAKERGDTLELYLQNIGISRDEWSRIQRDRFLELRSRGYLTGRFPDRAYDVDRFRPSVETWVRPSEILAWGRRNRADIERPESVTLRFLYLLRIDFPDAERFEGVAGDLERRFRAGEASVAGLGRPFPGTGEGGLHPPVTRASRLRQEYLDWAFAPGRAAGDVSERFLTSGGLVVLRLEGRTEAGIPDVDEWGPRAFEEIQEGRRTLAWAEVRARLVEEGAVFPPAVRATLLDQIRSEAREARLRLEPPDEVRTAAVPVR